MPMGERSSAGYGVGIQTRSAAFQVRPIASPRRAGVGELADRREDPIEFVRNLVGEVLLA
jgi:hypothetical protein